MASTYSTNLKIVLMGTGDQAGTWGTTTNTNMGTALEQAIVGYGNPNFTTDADLTITLTDSNATQIARNLALNVTSSVSLTTTRNLIVPTIQKPYVIRNNTSGSQSIVVKTSAGTGVTVPNGAYTVVYTDGTNVVSQITHLPALTLTTPLPVPSGGTGASTSTGSGAVVLATGPTVTDIDPASSVTDGATGYPIGYKDIPQNPQSGNYTLVLGDRGKHIYLTSTAKTITIPADASVAFPVGTAVTFVNLGGGNNTINASGAVTVYWAGVSGSTGSRTIGNNGFATALKVATDVWIISGAGLS